MVIVVIVAAELLKQAAADSKREDLATAWINRKMLELEMHAKRVSEGTVEQIERCERLVDLFEGQ